ncbi:TPA: hypothetical protein PTV74_003397 [Clostridium botulinum]|nr:hypothetical protein [Clostridium botulinum]HDK7206549.1 hypothetical protein [Clostridium botulinum]HDK7210284.1 hypothetical protein [Clostridium botulinum]HDK7265734.1 hypothetical protein [Clostridium botulinum]HDK7269581.1 hypothetical protein [Clostridium botulinum]
MDITNGFITREMLLQPMVCIALTLTFTQLIKEIKGVKDIPTKFVAIIVGMLTVVFGHMVNDCFIIKDLYIMIINGVFVGLTAMASHDFPDMISKKNKNKDVQTINNFYGASVEDTNIVTDTKEFDNVIKG